MATEQLGAYVMVAGSAAMLVLTIRVLGIRRVVWALVLVMLIAFALGVKARERSAPPTFTELERDHIEAAANTSIQWRQGRHDQKAGGSMPRFTPW